MAGSTAGIPGKLIYELDELKLLKASAVFSYSHRLFVFVAARFDAVNIHAIVTF